MPISGWFNGDSLRRRVCCLLLGLCVFCFPISYALAHGGGSGSSGSGSGSGSSGSSGSGSSGGHGGPGGTMGSSSAGPGAGGGLPANGPSGNGSGHGSIGHAAGHASSATSTHGTSISHNATVAASKNSGVRSQVSRNGFTSDTMLARSPDRIRNRQISSGATSTGESSQETDRRKKLKTNSTLAKKNATLNRASH